MTDFLTPLDIANRALQHVGSRRVTSLDAGTGGNYESKGAAEIASCYDKLRRAELRRNVWVFSAKRAMIRPIATTTLLLKPPPFSATRYYQPGEIVADSNGKLWTTMDPFTYNQTPGTGTSWQPYFGPLTVSEYDDTDLYYAGEAVYDPTVVAGLTNVYIARRNTTSDDATAGLGAEAWDSTATYNRGDIVSYSASNYISAIDLNVNQTPSATYSLWSATTTYAITNTVVGLDGRIYESRVSSNTGHEPYPEDTTYWEAASAPPYAQAWVASNYSVSNAWRYYGNGATDELASINLPYPLGAASSVRESGRSIYRLPAGYLRMAPQEPKAGSVSFLGAPSGLSYTDWELNGNFMTTREVYPIALRFVADVTDVAQMDPMFCEGLACRIALEVCETLTQSDSKLGNIAGMYKGFMTEARMVNAIEAGATEPALDDYIQCRA